MEGARALPPNKVQLDCSLAGFPRACCRATDNKAQPMGVPPPSIISMPEVQKGQTGGAGA